VVTFNGEPPPAGYRLIALAVAARGRAAVPYAVSALEPVAGGVDPAAALDAVAERVHRHLEEWVA
jgi:hypothetical protein